MNTPRSARSFLTALIVFAVPAIALSQEADLFIKEGPLGAGRVFVQAAFNLNSDYCLLDSGARISVVEDSHSYPASLPKVGESTVVGIGGQKRVVDVVAVDRILIGVRGISFFKRQILRFSPAPWDCVIGNDLLKELVLTYDFKNRKLYTSKLTSGHPLIDLDQKWSGVSVTIGESEWTALWDTGATQTVMDLSLIKANQDLFEFVSETEIGDATQKTVRAEIHKLKRMIIGGHQIEDTYVYGLDLKHFQESLPEVKIILGYNAISRFSWTLNHAQKLWMVHKNGSEP